MTKNPCKTCIDYTLDDATGEICCECEASLRYQLDRALLAKARLERLIVEVSDNTRNATPRERQVVFYDKLRTAAARIKRG